jgi:methylenetetrahydrofolate--tRNA-(uracil-5-)-methyltransferase
MAALCVTIVGGGLAGSEAAWQVARRGVPVRLFEMRPVRNTEVHRTDRLAELVCSNSMKSMELSSAHGLLKAEMNQLGSLILDAATANRVPAGAALAVDRERFAEAVTGALEREPGVTIFREEVKEIPEGEIVVLSAGPLVSRSLAASIADFTGEDHLYFYDAIAPEIEAASIDREIVFAASRYGKGEREDYLNCPMTEAEYTSFIDELLAAEKAPLHELDNTPFFEGCLPIEEMARRGRDTPRFGPMKPVGLIDPRSGDRPWAVVQLRQDNLAAEHFSMVGFQTQLRHGEQKRVFRMIPGLGCAEFIRLGQVHRNCYINAPAVLGTDLQAKRRKGLFFAGQISGVEGYTEAAATGLLAGINAALLATGDGTIAPPRETLLGALCHYISHSPPDGYQPQNAAFGLLPPPPRGIRRKKERRLARSSRALETLRSWAANQAAQLKLGMVR